MSGIPAQCGLTGSIDVRFDGEVAILIMRRGQNRINDSFFDGMEKALDKVERYVPADRNKFQPKEKCDSFVLGGHRVSSHWGNPTISTLHSFLSVFRHTAMRKLRC